MQIFPLNRSSARGMGPNIKYITHYSYNDNINVFNSSFGLIFKRKQKTQLVNVVSWHLHTTVYIQVQYNARMTLTLVLSIGGFFKTPCMAQPFALRPQWAEQNSHSQQYYSQNLRVKVYSLEPGTWVVVFLSLHFDETQ